MNNARPSYAFRFSAEGIAKLDKIAAKRAKSAGYPISRSDLLREAVKQVYGISM